MSDVMTRNLILILIMAAVIFFCRVFPFILFSGSSKKSEKLSVFLSFIERIVPPATMTVLAFNSIAVPFRGNPLDGIIVLAASVFTLLIHLLKRNPLISIFGGTAVYIILSRVMVLYF